MIPLEFPGPTCGPPGSDAVVVVGAEVKVTEVVLVVAVGIEAVVVETTGSGPPICVISTYASTPSPRRRPRRRRMTDRNPKKLQRDFFTSATSPSLN